MKERRKSQEFVKSSTDPGKGKRMDEDYRVFQKHKNNAFLTDEPKKIRKSPTIKAANPNE